MNRMRKALATAGLLAALPGIAAAQTISTTAGELTFSGLFTTDGPDDIPQTADDGLGAPNATANVSGVGYLNSGAFFNSGPIAGYPFSPLFRSGGFTENFANYTFVFEGGRYSGTPGTLGTPGTIVDGFSGPGDPSVVTEYTSGILNIYRATTAAESMDNDYANRASFANGTLFLSSNITFLRSSFNPSVNPPQGSVTGNLTFTGGELFTQFLQPNGILTGTVDATTNLAQIPGYDFRSDGQINANVIPEPSTYMLMGTGLLALAGFARRRRI